MAEKEPKKEQMDIIKQKYLKELKEEYSAKMTKSVKELRKTKDIEIEEGSVEYLTFKNEIMPAKLSMYEKACRAFSFVEITPGEDTLVQLQDAIETSHIDVTPKQAYSFAMNFSVLFMLTAFFIQVFYLFYSRLTNPEAGLSLYFVMVILIVSGLLYYFLSQIPYYFANSWRMKTTNQMILGIFYLVTYMRHTSNLERAVYFASRYIAPPLSLDFKKILWDVEMARYSTIKESVDSYLKTWQKFNSEFVDAFHLIESSLYESNEPSRIALLDKALDVVLEGTYENMLHYANNLKSPITIVHMLGIIMPILGLVVLPLMVTFLPAVKWYHVAIIYNVLLPIGVYFFGRTILSTRPTGYGSVDITEIDPKLKQLESFDIGIGSTKLKLSPMSVSICIFILLFLIGYVPIIIHTLNPSAQIMIAGVDLLDYRCEAGIDCQESAKVGPFGVGAVVLSLFMTLAFSLSFGFYYWFKSRRLIHLRNDVAKLDSEFSTGLFQLGNRLSDGMPPEVAFGKVSSMMGETRPGKFFRRVNENVTNLGMSVKAAIFDKKIGVLLEYPSPLIASSMQVLVEASVKGPKIAANAVASIARYVKEIHRVNERLKDVLSDVVSSMESQIKFLTPAIAGIVVGITSMMSYIIGTINKLFAQLPAGTDQGQATAVANIGGIIQGSGIPSYHFQIIIGLYVTEILFVLAYFLSNIRDGDDVIAERFTIGHSLIYSVLLYVAISAVVVIIFDALAAGIISSVIGAGV